MKGVKVAVVGVGKMGEYHAGVLSDMAQADLVAVVDINEDRARAIGDRYSVPCYLDYKKLIGKAEAVVVAVPTKLHYSMARDLLQAGVHVLLEKPCTNDLDQARELFECAEKKGLTLHIGHIERFNGAVQELNNIVMDPIYVEAKRTGPFNDRIEGDGVILDVMIHDIDIVLNLIQSRVVRTTVVGASVFSGKDDLVSAQLEFENNCIASIVASRASQNKVRTLGITQKDAFVLLDYTDQEIYIHRHASSEHQLSKGSLRYKQESLVERIFVHKENPLKLEHLHFLDCAKNGSPRKVAVDRELYSLEIALDILNQFNENLKQTPA